MKKSFLPVIFLRHSGSQRYICLLSVSRIRSRIWFFFCWRKKPTQLWIFVGYLGTKTALLLKPAACLEPTLSLQSINCYGGKWNISNLIIFFLNLVVFWVMSRKIMKDSWVMLTFPHAFLWEVALPRQFNKQINQGKTFIGISTVGYLI